MRLLSVGLLSLLIISGTRLNAENFTPSRIANPNPGMGQMIILGDSLANGHGADKGSATSQEPTRCFSKNFPGDLLNIAVNGATSKEALVSAEKSLKTDGHAKLYFVSSGGNDVMKNIIFSNYPTAKTLKEMGVLFDQLISTGGLVVYLGLEPPAVPPYIKTERLPQISALAHSKGVIVVDGMKDMWLDKSLMYDQVHPNNEGYKIMCQAIVEAVTPHYP